MHSGAGAGAPAIFLANQPQVCFHLHRHRSTSVCTGDLLNVGPVAAHADPMAACRRLVYTNCTYIYIFTERGIVCAHHTHIYMHIRVCVCVACVCNNTSNYLFTEGFGSWLLLKLVCLFSSQPYNPIMVAWCFSLCNTRAASPTW